MNIEEAQADVMKAAKRYVIAAVKDGNSNQGGARMLLEDAVRAGFLAVLDEAKECVIPHGDLEQWDDEALRDRIEELGK